MDNTTGFEKKKHPVRTDGLSIGFWVCCFFKKQKTNKQTKKRSSEDFWLAGPPVTKQLNNWQYSKQPNPDKTSVRINLKQRPRTHWNSGGAAEVVFRGFSSSAFSASEQPMATHKTTCVNLMVFLCHVPISAFLSRIACYNTLLSRFRKLKSSKMCAKGSQNSTLRHLDPVRLVCNSM